MENINNFVELRTAFQMFDKDGDSVINRSELKNIFADIGHECMDEDIDEMFKQYQCKEGIDFPTFLEIATQKRFSQKTLDKELNEAFKIFDRDNINNISKEDLSYILKNFCRTLTPQEVDELILEIDENGDGNISFEEFINMILMK